MKTNLVVEKYFPRVYILSIDATFPLFSCAELVLLPDLVTLCVLFFFHSSIIDFKRGKKSSVSPFHIS